MATGVQVEQDDVFYFFPRNSWPRRPCALFEFLKRVRDQEPRHVIYLGRLTDRCRDT